MSTLRSVKWNFVLGKPVTSFCIHTIFFQINFVFLNIFSLFFENNTKTPEIGKSPEKLSSRSQEGRNTKTGDRTIGI